MVNYAEFENQNIVFTPEDNESLLNSYLEDCVFPGNSIDPEEHAFACDQYMKGKNLDQPPLIASQSLDGPDEDEFRDRSKSATLIVIMEAKQKNDGSP